MCQNASKEWSQDNWVSLSSFDSVGNMKYGHFQFRVFFREFKVKELAFVVIRTLLMESPAPGGGGGTHAPQFWLVCALTSSRLSVKMRGCGTSLTRFEL